MNHGIRTHDERHPNFCRDLTKELLTPAEWARLRAWQETQEATARTRTIPARNCAVCGEAVPLLRRLDSTTCSTRCAATLRQRTHREGLRAAGRAIFCLPAP